MQDTIETAMDRTQILDIEKLWPDPLKCPDWPFETATRRFEGAYRGRRGAEERLESLSALLNRSGKVHPPSEHEQEGAFVRVFSRKGAMFHYLGLSNLGPLDRTTEEQACMIVEAAHIRGYLRKLDFQEAGATAAKERRERAEAESTLERWLTMVADEGRELAELAEAEARHKQRIEDERAAERCATIRTNVRHAHFPARQAAAKLGGTAPELPAFAAYE